MNSSSPRVGAIVLAGGRVPTALAPYCDSRATLQLGGRLMLAYLLDTLMAVDSIAGTVIVAPEETLPVLDPLPGATIAAGETLVENMRRGAQALVHLAPTHYLFITGDIPLVTVEGVRDYVQRSLESGAALTYPIIPREASEARFPGAKRTYVKIKEGTFTGGNAIFTTANLLDDKHALIQSLYAARKQPLKLAGILGWNTVLRLLTGHLDLPYLETVATRILSAPARALIVPHAEIGFDVDKPEDLRAVEAALKAG